MLILFIFYFLLDHKNNIFDKNNIVFIFSVGTISKSKKLKSSYKIFFLIFFIPFLLIGQNFKSDRTKLIFIEEMDFKLDSFSIVLSTLKIKSLNHQIIPQTSYNLNEIESTIKITDTLLLRDTLIFNYQVYPVLAPKTFYNEN